VATVIHNANAHSPVILKGFGFGSSRNGFNVDGIERVFGFHGFAPEKSKTSSIAPRRQHFRPQNAQHPCPNSGQFAGI
jgi:hypothetical protein